MQAIVILFLVAGTTFGSLLPLDERVAEVRATLGRECLPQTIAEFINASVLVLASVEATSTAELSPAIYHRLAGRLLGQITQNMAPGLPFCHAFGRAAVGLVTEWTTQRLPAPEKTYRSHCQHVLGASGDAAYLLQEQVPAYLNDLYHCLRIVMALPPSNEMAQKRSTYESRTARKQKRFI